MDKDVMYNGTDKEIFLVEEKSLVYNSSKDFTTLFAWEKCNEVKLYFYNTIVPNLPKEEIYNLIAQIKRAAISITANIAEGYGRFHYKESIQFYRISRGSLYELKDYLLSCKTLYKLNEDLINQGMQLIEEAKIKLNGFIIYVQNKK
jgi:four helix bundle protein